MTKDKIYEVLTKLNSKMEIPPDCFGFERREVNGIIKQLQNEGFISGASFAEGGRNKAPLVVWLERAYITLKGLEFIESFEEKSKVSMFKVDLPHEFIVSCSKIADNPASYETFDEDALNREIRNLLDSAISRFGYSIADQSQLGFGKTEKKSGEVDIRITKEGIPIAIYEGLIHNNKQYLFNHIDKAITRYNQSGCKAVYVVEFSSNVDFDRFWNNSKESVKEHEKINSIEEVTTELLGIKMLKGVFDWNQQKGDFYYIGVNRNIK